ncbi:MAG: chlorite dismutase family protein [Deltaproteobacteria bacterium]|nr:chlorite dismutase family protein [Deltaproteobacteria bacterium]
MADAKINNESRQFVSFTFYKVDSEWKRLSEKEKQANGEEWTQTIKQVSDGVLLRSYSTLGMKADCDFMLWKIASNLESLNQLAIAIQKTALGKHLQTPYSYLAMTKRSTYVDQHQHEGQEGTRLTVVPGKAKYLFVYPFVKTKAWYQLSQEERQKAMNEHIETGHRYPSVKLHTTYSFGLDDQEFVVAFESDKPEDFLDLVMDLRSSKATGYTLKDTPVFTCIRQEISDILKSF